MSLERGKRIPIHNHEDFDSGGLVAAHTIVTASEGSVGTAGTPTLAEVLAAGNETGPIVILGGVNYGVDLRAGAGDGGDALVSLAPGGGAEGVGGNVQIYAGNGDAGDAGGSISIYAGFGDDGANAGAAIDLDRGDAGGNAGKIGFLSDNSYGDSGQVPTADGAGKWTWEDPGAGGGVPSGTSFPGSPSTDDLYYRTDRGILYQYDGTRWLGPLDSMYLGHFEGITATASVQASLAAWEADYDVWLVSLYASMYCAGSLSGSAYWTLSLTKYDGATPTTGIGSVNDLSGTNATYERKSAAIGALLGTSMDGLEVVATKTSTPQALYAAVHVSYRLVG